MILTLEIDVSVPRLLAGIVPSFIISFRINEPKLDTNELVSMCKQVLETHSNISHPTFRVFKIAIMFGLLSRVVTVEYSIFISCY